jgi:hypothetical protein
MTDFASAAARHWDNTFYLANAGRWQESAYLAGYVAECSLKALLQNHPLSNMQNLGQNLVILSGDALDLALLLAPVTSRYRIETLRPNTGVGKWNPEQRYEATNHTREAEFRDIVREAENIAQKVLIGMVLDGFLPEVPE